jgi:hypothetical protein
MWAVEAAAVCHTRPCCILFKQTPVKKEKRDKKCETEVRTFGFISQILNAQAKGKGEEYFNVLDVTLSTVK